MGYVKVTNKVYGVNIDNTIVPGGPIKQKHATGEFTGIDFSKVDVKDRNL